jgi:uncharacterized protein YndB with AHSA1/START domain
MPPEETASSQELKVTVRRVIRAPRERVFDAWIRPEWRKQWWVASDGSQPAICEVDGCVGGRYRLSMHAPDYEWLMEGTFLEIDRPRLLVFTWSVNDPDVTVRDNRVTIEFHEVDDGTEIVLTHEGSPTPSIRNAHEGGWKRCLGQLADLVERPTGARNAMKRSRSQGKQVSP